MYGKVKKGNKNHFNKNIFMNIIIIKFKVIY